MRIRVYPDIRLRFAPFTLPPMDAYAVVLAGDIGEGLVGVEWARQQFQNDEIVYVAGNHEFYSNRLSELVRPPVDLSILGHAQESIDYTVDGTRVLANPRGYAPPDDNPRVRRRADRRGLM